MPDIGATFVGELKAGLDEKIVGKETGFPIAGSEFDRRLGFPQLLISYAGIDPERARGGERVPRAQIQCATGYVRSPNPDAHEVAEDAANKLYDSVSAIGPVLAFDFNGMTRFEPLDGRESEYFGLLFVVERAGGVRRG